MTSIKLKGLVTRHLKPLAGNRLKRRCGDDADEISDMCAAAGASQQRLDTTAESGPDRQANQFFIIRGDLIAIADIGHRVGGRLGIDDRHRPVDGDT